MTLTYFENLEQMQNPLFRGEIPLGCCPEYEEESSFDAFILDGFVTITSPLGNEVCIPVGESVCLDLLSFSDPVDILEILEAEENEPLELFGGNIDQVEEDEEYVKAYEEWLQNEIDYVFLFSDRDHCHLSFEKTYPCPKHSSRDKSCMMPRRGYQKAENRRCHLVRTDLSKTGQWECEGNFTALNEMGVDSHGKWGRKYSKKRACEFRATIRR